MTRYFVVVNKYTNGNTKVELWGKQKKPIIYDEFDAGSDITKGYASKSAAEACLDGWLSFTKAMSGLCYDRVTAYLAVADDETGTIQRL